MAKEQFRRRQKRQSLKSSRELLQIKLTEVTLLYLQDRECLEQQQGGFGQYDPPSLKPEDVTKWRR